MFSFFLILSLCTSSQSLLFGTKFNAHLLLDRPRHRLCTSRRCVGDYRGKDNSQPLLHTQLQNEDILNGSAPPIKDAYNQIEEDMFLHSKADFVRSNSDRANVLSFLSQYKDSFSYLIPIILLILQNSGLILFMRYSIIRSKRKMYIVSTAVFCSELIKFILSVLLSYSQDVQRSLSSFRDLLYLECVTKKDEFLKIIIPSILYSLQNNLQYVAVANLSAPVFQTMYQMKIVTAALFSVIMLKRRLLVHQWASIFTLFLGASAVQLSQQGVGRGAGTSNLTGLVTVIISCFTSGFSGVYFEKTLKNKKATASIWLRNVQMSFFGILLSVLGCLTTERGRIRELGFFYGYNEFVWIVILLQALGGLVVSMVVKNADNLMKGFATSLSIILSCALSSIFFHDLKLSLLFILGSTTVVASTIAFGYTPKSVEGKANKKAPPPPAYLTETAPAT